MRQVIHLNNSYIINNFVMKCIESIFYLLFYAESDQQTCASCASVHVDAEATIFTIYISQFLCIYIWGALIIRISTKCSNKMKRKKVQS